MNPLASIGKGLLKKAGIYVTRRRPDYLIDHLLQLFATLGINCLIDVGAHYGEYGMEARNAGYRGRIVSFEPTTEAFEQLKRYSANDPNWAIYKHALGPSESTMTINVSSESVFSSFRETTAFGARHFHGMHVTDREAVPVRTLDSVFESCIAGIPSPRVFLKVDTQGFDLEVLRGAPTALERILGGQIEVPGLLLYKDVPTMAESIGLLTRQGFAITGMYPIVRDAGLAVIEFDCVFRRYSKENGG